jgi:asparagine synthase (glutamine-hydrolysing)
MCGISALLSYAGVRPLIPSVRAMTELVRHRGPDGEGYAVWGENDLAYFFGGADTPAAVYDVPRASRPRRELPPDNQPVYVAFGHRRLAIQDRGPRGHQPMASEDGAAVIIFNGEIYNERGVREELVRLGRRFASESDTETVLHAYRQWGVQCLRRLNGMFTFVIFEPRAQRVFIARDRFGVKPCYLWRSPADFVAIASEIKQFTVLEGWCPVLNAQAAYAFLNHGVTDHSRNTMFDDVLQLRGGEYIDCTLAEMKNPAAQIRRWYTLSDQSRQLGFAAAAAEFRSLFADAVSLRLRADVPVGATLSGGIDSSSIVCQSKELRGCSDAGRALSTFSACFHDPRHDERQHVDRVVRHAGADAHYVYPRLDDFLEQMPKMLWHHDEPFDGASFFAEWCVYALVAKTPVKVTLDGHGADELLSGYHSFFGHYFADLFWRGRWLLLRRELLATHARHGHGVRFLLSHVARLGAIGHVAQAIDSALGRGSADASWMEIGGLGVDEYDLRRELGGRQLAIKDFSISQMLATSLPYQLRASDRSSMAHGIESRSPFLDYRLVEFALGCPDEYKIAHGTTKRLLRAAMQDIVPPDTLRRQDKMGFMAPEQFWICHEQPERFKSLAASAVARACGIVNQRALDRAVRIIEGREPFDLFVMRLILFSRWLDVYSVAVH